MYRTTLSKSEKHKKPLWVFVLATFTVVILTVLISLLHMTIGAKYIPWHTALDAVFNFDKTQFVHHIVIKQRLPRLMVAISCGAMLGLAGFQAQKLLQNPLVSPTTLGVTSGAVFFVIVGMFFFNLSPLNIFLPSLFGALFAGFLAFSITRIMTKSDVSRGVHIVLAGSLVGMLFRSLSIFVMSLDPLQFYQLQGWLLGDIAPINFKSLQVVWWVAVLGVIVLLSQSKALDTLMLGDKQAITLGTNVKRIKFLSLGGIFIVLALAVSVVGPIGFIGLVVPHIVKIFVNETGSRGAWLSMILGALLLVLADVVARYIFAPKVVVVGAVTASIGGVFFLGLLFVKARRNG